MDIRCGPSDVRFGSEADMCGARGHVRFTPNSDIDCVLRHVRFGPEAGMCTAMTHVSVNNGQLDPPRASGGLGVDDGALQLTGADTMLAVLVFRAETFDDVPPWPEGTPMPAGCTSFDRYSIGRLARMYSEFCCRRLLATASCTRGRP